MNILLVDDDDNSRVFLERTLTKEGHSVTTATNGVQALEGAGQQSPDVIISDIMMPEMDGFELCRRVKSDKELRAVPFVFYTATFVDRRDEELAMALGASRFVVKPMEIGALLGIINEVLEQHVAHRLPAPKRPKESAAKLKLMYSERLAEKLNKKVKQLEKQRYYLMKAQEIGCFGTWELDIEKNRLVWTDENYRIFGLDVGTELTYETFLHCVHPDDRAYVDEKWKAALNKEPYDIEHRLLVDGKVKWVREKADLKFDEKGIALLAIGFTQDITNRKKYEQALWESEERFRTLVEQSPLSVQILAPDGKTVQVNRAWEELWELTLDDLKDYNILHDKQLEESGLLQYLHKAYSGEPAFIPAVQYDAAKTIGKGPTRWVQANAYPVKDEGGNTRIVVIMHEDITERKRAEEELEKQRFYLAKAQEMGSIGTWELDVRKNKLIWTDENYRVFGLPLGTELTYETFLSCVHPDDREYVGRKWTAALRNEPYDIEHRLVVDGKVKWVREKADVQFDEQGNAVLGTGFTQDITDRKQAEKALRMRQQETEAMLVATRSIPENKTFEEAAQGIFDALKKLLGADSGYVALLSADGQENEVLFLDSGGRPCTVDPNLPMPIRGLRSEAYGKGTVVWENDFMASEWLKFMPGGHVELDNVLFAPILVGGKPVGAIGLANKPGGFSEHDAEMARAFADIAAVGLHFAQDQEALLESEKELNTIFNSSPVAMLLLDRDTSIRKANLAAATLADRKAEDMRGRRPGDAFRCICHLEDPRGCGFGPQCGACAAHATIKDTLETGDPKDQVEVAVTVEHEGIRANQSLLVSTAPLSIAGRPHVLVAVENISDRKEAERNVHENRAQLKSLASQLSYTEERERHRLATTLHDQIGQSLVLSKLKLDELRTSGPSGQVADVLEDVCGSLAQVIQETRTLTFDLSSPILYELGIEAAVAEWLADEIREKHGIETEFDDDGRQKPLDDDIMALLFRNVRELLINVVKHAHARRVKVAISRVEDDVCVIVEDDGVGFDPAEVRAMAADSDRFGLFSIRERLEQLGGLIEIDSEPGHGSRVEMRVPLKCETLTDRTEL